MKKTQSFKTWHLVVLAVVIVLAIGQKIYNSMWTKATIQIAGQQLRVLVADTYDHRLQGWSGKKDMGKYDGMLFVFPRPGRPEIVMRDMNFPLDVVWINGTEIVDIAPNLMPEPNRMESDLTRYGARATSTLVLELPGGFKDRYGLKIGDTVEILK
jgi:uncharacterized membrane protein (UPF0127 family)